MKLKNLIESKYLIPSMVMLTTIISHLLFSPLGFNPTDDGFTLAYSRRILEGQVPHLDFIIIRPFISPLLHVPVLLIGGEYTFYLSRFVVWLQLSLISFFIVKYINVSLDNFFSRSQEAALYAITFALAAHNFAIMAWHTIDGLLFCTFGLFLMNREGKANRNAAYLLFGFAFLCKQSFLPVGIAALFMYRDYKQLSHWVMLFIPLIVYFLYLSIAGAEAISAGISQLTSQRGILSIARYYIVSLWFPAGVITGFLLISIMSKGRNRGHIATYNLLAAILLIIVISLLTGILAKTSLFMLGMFIASYPLWRTEIKDDFTKASAIFMTVVLSFSSSVSLGYPYPVFLSGGIVVLFMWIIFSKGFKTNLNTPFIIAAAIVITASFFYGRYNYIYRDTDVSRLNYNLEGVLEGGTNIYTNKKTFEVLSNLRKITDRQQEQNKVYAIVPEIAAAWVKSENVNPLPIDWIYRIELNNQELVEKVRKSIISRKGQISLIVQKYDAGYLPGKIEPPSPELIISFIRENFRLVSETKYHYVFE